MTWPPRTLRRFFHRRSSNEEIVREIAAHLEAERAENQARGMNADEARRQAHIKFGPPRRVQEDLWRRNSFAILEDLLRDLKYAIRTLARTPVFTATAILVMALGIGANTALFTVVKSVLLNPLPYRDPGRLVSLYEYAKKANDPSPYNPVAAGVYAEWQKGAQRVQQMALVSPWQQYNVAAHGGQLPETIEAAWCSANLFSTLGVLPAQGRGFTAADDREGAPATVILSHGFWKRRFNSDSTIVGKQIWLDARPYTVIGIMPASFAYPYPTTQLWTPVFHEAPPPLMRALDDHRFWVVGRLRQGATLAGVVSELDTMQKRIKLAHPEPGVFPGALGRTLLDDTVADSRTPLYVMLAATICVLFIACINVANLLVARSAARQKDLAIRAALGGSRWRLIREHVVESLVLALAGGLLGLAFAALALAWLAHAHVALARAEAVHFDWTVLLFVVAVSSICGVLAGLVPSLQLNSGQLLDSLQQSSRSHSGGKGRARLRKMLLTVEVGLTVVLLIAAGLLLKSYQRLLPTDPGCAVDNVLTMRVSLPQVRYKDSPQKVAFFEQLIARIRALPGVQAAGLVDSAPAQGWGNDDLVTVVEHPPLPKGQALDTMMRGADPGYFQAMQIPLVRGRTFTSSERLDHAHVTLISQSAARQYLPGEDPVGRHLKIGITGDVYEIIGVVGDTPWMISQPVRPTMYWPLYSGIFSHATILLRSSRDVETLALPVQRIVGDLDHDLPISHVLTLRQSIGASTVQNHFNSTLVAAFAIIALLLAAVGLYGVLSYLVTQRTAELGIRIALGAQRSEVLRLTLADGLAPVGLGLAAGLAAAAIIVQFLRSMLYGISPLDWSVFTLVVAVLAITAGLACALPAWRATQLDPARALRAE